MIEPCIGIRRSVFVLAWISLLIAVLIDCAVQAELRADRGRVYGVLGHDLLTECPVAALLSTNESETTWYKGDVQLSINEERMKVLTNGSLLISVYKSSDRGDYYCTVSTTSGILVSTMISIRDSVDEPIIFSTTSYLANQGDSIRLTCPIDSWVPQPNVQWYHGAQAIPAPNNSSARQAVLPGGVLHLTDLTSSDSGTYWCVATVSDSHLLATSTHSQNNITLTISMASESTEERSYHLLSYPPHTVNLTAGEDLYLECLLNPANGESIIWQRQDGDAIGWHDVHEDNSLTIVPNQYLMRKTVNFDVGGDYRCVVQSAARTHLEIHRTFVIIGTPPTFTEPIASYPLRLEVESTREGVMRCPIRGYPAPTLTWLKDGQPVDICHNRQVNEQGALSIEHVSTHDEGIYQCIQTNSYGSISLPYILTLQKDDKLPPKPVITEAEFVGPSRIHLKFESCHHRLEKFVTAYFGINYVNEICIPSEKTLGELITYEDAECVACELSLCQCCQWTQEVDSRYTNYTVQLAAFNIKGGVGSDYVTVVSPPDVTSPSHVRSDLGLKVLDFGTALLIHWRRVSAAEGYELELRHEFHEGDRLIQSIVIDRDAQQNYTVIEGYKQNLSLSVEVEALIDPPQLQRIESILPRLPPFNQALVPNLTLIPITTDTSKLNLFVIWSEVSEADFYYLWYKCDNQESLLRVSADTLQHQISGIQMRCDVVVGPVVGGRPQLAAITSYNRWCQEIPTPYNVKVSPLPQTGARSDKNDLIIEWSADKPTETCEVNYMVRWKLPESPLYADLDSAVVQSNNRTVVKGFRVNVSYDIQVTAFTNASDLTKSSAAVSYTVGPPLRVSNVHADFTQFPDSTVITWASPESDHQVTMYFIMLYHEQSPGVWETVNQQTIRVKPGKALIVEYPSLSAHSVYNVSIGTVNLHGAGEIISLVFVTPDEKQLTVTTQASPATFRLSNRDLGIVVGFSLAVLIIFLSVLACILLKKRSKRPQSRRSRSRSRGHRSAHSTSYNHMPLTVDTSNFEMTSLTLGVSSHNLENDVVVGDIGDNSNPNLPPLRALGSPLQLSLKATSAQDSGIDGVAEDHRSSQDLGGYDEEAGHVMTDSNISLDSNSSNVSSRWSCDIPNNVKVVPHRVYKTSECDSLLTDSSRPSMSSAVESKSTDRLTTKDYLHSPKIQGLTYHSLISEPPDHHNLSLSASTIG